MKQRPRRTPRREADRLEHKRERAAVRQVLDGGHQRLVRHSSWSRTPVQTPDVELPDVTPTPPPRSGKAKKQSRPRPFCPARGPGKRHHFLYDTEIVDEWYLTKPYEREYKLCGWCGLELPASKVRRKGRWGRL